MNEDYDYLADDHIRNIQRLTNGKSANENYVDILNCRRQTIDRMRRQYQAKQDEKALIETIRKTVEKELEKQLKKLLK